MIFYKYFDHVIIFMEKKLVSFNKIFSILKLRHLLNSLFTHSMGANDFKTQVRLMETTEVFGLGSFR